ncbi:hypothetical protein PHET_01390 [Paragonimus heterotremus]|uniref:Uncharacterized protein n=1 Tax=Paragonimus heterotremus TaxID=100268 RepID=A0A8J4T5M1_9TREM|nr:hypothetical protein PHET_01390 [Paragonimus heterotremus]
MWTDYFSVGSDHVDSRNLSKIAINDLEKLRQFYLKECLVVSEKLLEHLKVRDCYLHQANRNYSRITSLLITSIGVRSECNFV